MKLVLIMFFFLPKTVIFKPKTDPTAIEIVSTLTNDRARKSCCKFKLYVLYTQRSRLLFSYHDPDLFKKQGSIKSMHA